MEFAGATECVQNRPNALSLRRNRASLAPTWQKRSNEIQATTTIKSLWDNKLHLIETRKESRKTAYSHRSLFFNKFFAGLDKAGSFLVD
jgi:hypothetical protein